MKETNRREEDLNAGYSNEGPHAPVYDPVILYAALLGAAGTGLGFGILGYLIAEGSWAIVDLGQISAVFSGTAAVTFAGVGIAVGGLIGGLIGLHQMLKNHHKSKKY
jgi:hypothetical protein